MAIVDALRVFHTLKQEGTVVDYMVFGSVAAMVHTRPFFTRDVDVAVDVVSVEEFSRVFRRLAKFGRVEGHAIVIDERLLRDQERRAEREKKLPFEQKLSILDQLTKEARGKGL